MIRNMETPPRVWEVILACAAQFEIPVGSLTAKTREPQVVAARRAVVRTLSDEGHSTTAIGRFLGGRHHSSVLHLLHTAGPTRRRLKFSIPQIRVGEGIEEDLHARLAEIAAHRKVMHGKLAELDDLESKLRLMLETLKPTERVA